MPDPSNAGDRTKAYRLRKARALSPVDKLWLSEYEEKQQRRQQQQGKNGRPKNFGASRSGRTIKLDVEEHAEAIGTGSAAVEAASAALAAKEEGRRLDSLTVNAVDALKEACAVYKDICLSLKERTEVLEETHVAMLDSVRDHFIARTQAEGALMQQQQESDPANMMLMTMIANRLGIDLPGIPPARPPSRAKPAG